MIATWHQDILTLNEMLLARSFNITFRYIDDVLSINHCKFGDFFYRIYPMELELKDTTDTVRFASYFYFHLKIDSDSRLRTKLFPIVIFPI
jgi:hypothetical protein